MILKNRPAISQSSRGTNSCSAGFTDPFETLFISNEWCHTRFKWKVNFSRFGSLLFSADISRTVHRAQFFSKISRQSTMEPRTTEHWFITTNFPIAIFLNISKVSKFAICVSGAILWNSLPSQLRGGNYTTAVFKKMLSDHFSSQD